ncbi:MAG: type IV secretory system conjugative DNA transfer family protein [Alphaproteobacteria bacterium]|nr:type IV secretory system conjugative DNA transfer family protein [Alphaproteobacteria bacterium]
MSKKQDLHGHETGVRKHMEWKWLSAGIALLVGGLLAFLSLPLIEFIDTGISTTSVDHAKDYITKSIKRPDYPINQYIRWAKYFFKNIETASPSLWIPFFPWFIGFGIFFVGLAINPHVAISSLHGTGGMADDKDIKKMGILKGFIIVLGKWKGKFLMLPETLSALVVAPPGTGKTVGVVIPTILHSPGITLIVNDPKPELCWKTSGFRQKEGPVFILNWGSEDNPAKGLYNPNWNPLSPKCIPTLGASRDLYVDTMVDVLVEEPKGGADPHWSKTGRLALAGLIHFITCKCENALANDYFIARLVEESMDVTDLKTLQTYYANMDSMEAVEAIENIKKGELTIDNYVPIGTWEGLPSEWVGCEACMSMLLEWMSNTQLKIAADIKRRLDEGDQMAALADPMRDLFDSAIQECVRFGYANRAIIELNQLAATPDKERGSILSTALTGISIFKNAAVRARTKTSDFAFSYFRGLMDPFAGEMRPITVYLSVNQADARALSPITGTFIELLSDYLISNPPNSKGQSGEVVGPFPVLFVLDEFPQMPKLQAVIDGPAVGRGQKVSYLLIGQDLGQITGQYGKDDLETIITTTAAKVVLTQNNEETAKRFSEMCQSKTVMVRDKSRSEGLGRDVKLWTWNVSRSWAQDAVYATQQFLNIPQDKQIIMMQGWMKNPIEADAPRYYMDKKMNAQCELPAAPAVPTWMIMRRPVRRQMSAA